MWEEGKNMRGLYTEKVTDSGKIDMINSILAKIKPEITEKVSMEQFHDDGEGVDRIYNVYKIISGGEIYS